MICSRFHLVGSMLSLILVIALSCSCVHGRIHNLNIIVNPSSRKNISICLSLQDDSRQQILLSTFGFLRGGSLNLNVTDFTFDKAGIGKTSQVSETCTATSSKRKKHLPSSSDSVLTKQRIVASPVIW